MTRYLLPIIALSLVVRLIVAFGHPSYMSIIENGYRQIASNIRAGNGYILDMKPPSEYYLPGYAYLSAVIFPCGS